MDRDELWFLVEMDIFNELTRDDDVFDDYFFSDEYLQSVYDEEDASPDPNAEWLGRRLNRHRRRPKRQLHPFRLRLIEKWERRIRSHHQAERYALVHRMGERDLDHQLDDYVAEQFTDVPSVGLSMNNAHFRGNVGEYVLMYELYAANDGEDDDLEAEPPQWLLQGFASEEEYLRYLADSSWFYETSWDGEVYETA